MYVGICMVAYVCAYIHGEGAGCVQYGQPVMMGLLSHSQSIGEGIEYLYESVGQSLGLVLLFFFFNSSPRPFSPLSSSSLSLPTD